MRLVVFDGPARAPVVVYNEKFPAGLGRKLEDSGAIAAPDMKAALDALRRFNALIGEMEVAWHRAVATAAVREASNGAELVAHAREFGLSIEVLTGEQEARASALGVMATFPDAHGIVADLGGGSLELARISNRRVMEGISLPFGVLRAGGDDPAGALAKAIKGIDWLDLARGEPLFMVGGSWRALARIDMFRTGYPLPVIGGYRMPRKNAGRLNKFIERPDLNLAALIPTLSQSRLPMLPAAGALLAVLAERIAPSELVSSAAGLREGILFERLDPGQMDEDALISAARFEGARRGRFGDEGDLIEAWLAPVFGEEAPALARLRQTACLLHDIAWSANPEFRAFEAMEAALHGNWPAASGSDRVIIAMALYAAAGGPNPPPALLARLAGEAQLTRARQWGLGIRLAQRLGGGTKAVLEHTRLSVSGGTLTLSFDPRAADLAGVSVDRRLRQFANAMGLKPATNLA